MFVIVQKIKLTILYSLFTVKLDSHGVVHEIFVDEFLNSAHINIVMTLNSERNGQRKTTEVTPVDEGEKKFNRERKN